MSYILWRKTIRIIMAQKVTVLEVYPNEDSQFLGMMIIMDMVVQMSDACIANIEIQKISYDFPVARISCYSADLVLRQYKQLAGKSELGKTGESMSNSLNNSLNKYNNNKMYHNISNEEKQICFRDIIFQIKITK